MAQVRSLSVYEIVQRLGIKNDTVYKWVGRFGLSAHKVGRLLRFQVREVVRWIREGKAAIND